jgi:hypothetical protein
MDRTPIGKYGRPVSRRTAMRKYILLALVACLGGCAVYVPRRPVVIYRPGFYVAPRPVYWHRY